MPAVDSTEDEHLLVRVRIRGGGTFPLLGSRCTYSYPLLELTADQFGLRVWARGLVGRVGSAMAGAGLPPGQRPGRSWSCAWADVAVVDAARRSFVLWNRANDGFRFVAVPGTSLNPLYELLAARHIRIRPVRSTWRTALSLASRPAQS